jgi:hypothetical protein
LTNKSSIAKSMLLWPADDPTPLPFAIHRNYFKLLSPKLLEDKMQHAINKSPTI